jgi:hypothetical protein
MNNEEYVAICRRLDDAEKTLGAVAKRLVEYQRVMKMLAEELRGTYKNGACEWDDYENESPSLIAYRALKGE